MGQLGGRLGAGLCLGDPSALTQFLLEVSLCYIREIRDYYSISIIIIFKFLLLAFIHLKILIVLFFLPFPPCENLIILILY